MDRVDRILSEWAAERPDLDVRPMGLVGRIIRLSRHLMREMEATLAEHGLSFAAFDVLATLRRSAPVDGLSPSALMEAMMITSGTTTHRIDQLEAQGLVVRAPNPEDQRSVIVRLSPRGRALVDEAVAAHAARQAALVASLRAGERAALSGLLATWLAAFDSEPGDPPPPPPRPTRGRKVR